MIKLIFLGLLGLYVTFIRKYMARKDKAKTLSFKYWLNDNWQELSQSIAFFIAAMFILLDSQTMINIDNWIDAKLFVFPAKQVAAFLIGWGINEIVYLMNRKKRAWVEKNKG